MNKITTIKNSQNDTPFIAGLWGKIGRQQTKNWLGGSRNNNKGERWERRSSTDCCCMNRQGKERLLHRHREKYSGNSNGAASWGGKNEVGGAHGDGRL